MTSTDARATRRGWRPTVGRTIPVSLMRLIMAVVMAILCFAIVGLHPYVAVALFLVVAAIVFPQTPAAWILAVLLAVFALGSFNSAPRWQFFVVLAGAHALHEFGMILGWLPGSGGVQLRILGRILRRYLIIQILAQVVSLVVLTLLAGKSVVAALTSPVFGVVAGMGLLLMVALVLVPLLRAKPDETR
jgi:hypothetical protein